MLDSLRRTVSALPTSTASTTVAPPVAPAPATSSSAPNSYFQDSFAAPSRSPVSLDGGSTLPVDPPSFLERILPPIGPKLEHVEDGWIPQGQGYDAGRGQVLTTYYRDIGGPFFDKGIW